MSNVRWIDPPSTVGATQPATPPFVATTAEYGHVLVYPLAPEAVQKLATPPSTRSGDGGLSSGEKILLASVVVSTIGLLVKLWSQIYKEEHPSVGD